MNPKVSVIALSAFVVFAVQVAEAHFLNRHAICVIRGDGAVEGVIKFEQKSAWKVSITGDIKGLSEGQHGFHVHEFGDLSNGCASTGGHYNPFGVEHGAPSDPITKRHVGDLGNVVANGDGTAQLQITDRLVKLYGAFSVVGRAIVVHKDVDDLGRGSFPDSKTTGHAGARVGCCVIGLANVPKPAAVSPMEEMLLNG